MPQDNLAAILDGWLATLRQLAKHGNPHAAVWASAISAEPTAGRRLVRFGDLRVWLLGIEVPGVPGIGKPPRIDDVDGLALYRALFVAGRGEEAGS
jgi:hypothetical protein